MSNVVVIGTQWGDEGKGKIVDWLSEKASLVVRFQGGHIAGHTLVVNEKIYSNSKSSLDKYLVYMPYFNINDADQIIKKGFRVVFGNNVNSDIIQDALNLKCQFIWENKKIVKLEN